MLKKNITDHKLTGEHKNIVIQMLADFRSNKEILEFIKEEHNIILASSAITYYKIQHEDKIIDIRKELNKRLLAIPVANKHYRIELRQKLIADIVEKGLWYTVRNKHGEHEKGNHGAINNILDSVKSELEPDKLALTDPSGNYSLIELIKRANESNGGK